MGDPPFPPTAPPPDATLPGPARTRDTGIDYVARVNRAIDHVLQHLDEPLSVASLAARAHFSPFHFHRIFRAVVGEPVMVFVRRRRLERSIALMTRAPERSLTEVALACGFSSSSDFARVFRRHYGVPPSRFDAEAFRSERRAEWVAAIADPEHRHLLEGLSPGENPDGFDVRIRDLPARRVAYVRVHDAYRPDAVPQAAARLVAWARPRGLADAQWLGYAWDDPEVVPRERCRYDVAVEVPASVDPEGEVGVFRFPAMRVAEVPVRGAIDLEMRCLDWLYGTWLPTSGHAPADHPAFEAWDGLPFAHGQERFELRVQLPVVPGGAGAFSG